MATAFRRQSLVVAVRTGLPDDSGSGTGHESAARINGNPANGRVAVPGTQSEDFRA
jgi:hypothetical protein